MITTGEYHLFSGLPHPDLPLGAESHGTGERKGRAGQPDSDTMGSPMGSDPWVSTLNPSI